MAEPLSIHERMAAILKELPPIGKDQKNVQQNFMFRGHDDVLNALNPLLAKHGVFVLPHVLARETTQRTTAKGSAMFEVSLLVEYTFYGAAGDSVRGSAWGEGTDMGDKATSKAMTMAFKSVLNQAFAISNKEFADPDAHTADESRAVSQPAQKAPTAKPLPAAANQKNPVPETDALYATLCALADEYKTLAPEFDANAVRVKSTEKIGRAGYKEWLERQIGAFQNNIAVKRGQAAAEEKFPIPTPPAEKAA